MPIFAIPDVICVPQGSPRMGSRVPLTAATVSPWVPFRAGADRNGYALATAHGAIGNALGGAKIIQTGTAEADLYDPQGRCMPRPVLFNYITTAEAKTFYITNHDLRHHDIAVLHILNARTLRANPIEQSVAVTDRDACQCFAADMPIDTPSGAIPAGSLEPGTLVKTMGGGVHPVRLVHRKKLWAMGDDTPVLFRRGTIGNTADVVVGQKHRIYSGALPAHVRSWFGTGEHSLIEAIEFCNGRSIRLTPQVGAIEYAHVMLDAPALLYCHGVVLESWHPGPRQNVIHTLRPDQSHCSKPSPCGCV